METRNSEHKKNETVLTVIILLISYTVYTFTNL
jgi:hypothetical protein